MATRQSVLALLSFILAGVGTSACTPGNKKTESTVREAVDLPAGDHSDADDGGTNAPCDTGNAVQDASEDPDEGDQRCRRGYVENGWVSIWMQNFAEIPIQSYDAYASRRLAVAERKIFDGYVGKTQYKFIGASDIGTELKVSIYVGLGWDVATQPGDSLQLEYWDTHSTCFYENSERLVENIPISGGVIRGDDGVLLLVSAGTIPLARDGTVLFGEDIPEVEFRWLDVGCPDYRDLGDVVEEYEGGAGLRKVAIEARDRSNPSVSVAVLPSEKGGEIILGGDVYILVVTKMAEMDRDSEWCTFGGFALYKKGYIIPPTDSGTGG